MCAKMEGVNNKWDGTSDVFKVHGPPDLKKTKLLRSMTVNQALRMEFPVCVLSK